MAQERGRPRSFDANEALGRALEIFWRNGFQGASLAELTDAMGLSKPSLYAAFGDKESLYLKALDRYASHWLAESIVLLEKEGDGFQAVQGFMRFFAILFTDPALPGGCFVVNGLADRGGPSTPAGVGTALQKTLEECEKKICQRLVRAQRDGQLPADADPAALAGFFYALLAGLAVKAKAGATRASLDAAVDAGMRAWPG